MSRGPYKCYEFDPNVLVPKTTCYRQKRKRQQEEIDSVCYLLQSSYILLSYTHWIKQVYSSNICPVICLVLLSVNYFYKEMFSFTKLKWKRSKNKNLSINKIIGSMSFIGYLWFTVGLGSADLVELENIWITFRITDSTFNYHSTFNYVYFLD